jgi:DNA-directed RNA polymerase subunit RPC12/RpoP
MPIPEEFAKKRTEVTISRASLQEISCKGCGAKIAAKNIEGGYARCEYCGGAYALAVDDHTVP